MPIDRAAKAKCDGCGKVEYFDEHCTAPPYWAVFKFTEMDKRGYGREQTEQDLCLCEKCGNKMRDFALSLKKPKRKKT